jgi:hypothetical protein
MSELSQDISNSLPRSIAVVSLLLVINGCLYVPFALGMLASGLFVGMHLVVPGVVVLSIGLSAVWLECKLLARARMIRGMVTVWALFALGAVGAACGAAVADEDEETLVLCSVSVCPGLSYVAIVLLMFQKSTRDWLLSQKDGETVEERGQRSVAGGTPS